MTTSRADAVLRGSLGATACLRKDLSRPTAECASREEKARSHNVGRLFRYHKVANEAGKVGSEFVTDLQCW